MQIDRPAAEGNPVGELRLAENVPLVQHVVTEKPPILPFPGDRPHPLQRHVRRIELARVLDVIPDPVDHRPQLVPDPLVVVHRVQLSAELDPPVRTPVVPRLDDPPLRDGGGADVLGEVRRHELHRMSGVLRVEEQRGAESDAVDRLRGPRLLELGARLTADAVVGAREVADQAVSGAVEEDGALEADPAFGAHHPAGGRDDPPLVVRALGLDLAHIGVEVERDAGLGAYRVQDDGVPVVRVPVRVAVLVLHEQLAHDAALAGMVVPAVAGRAAHPDADLAARVPAEYRPVVDQCDGPAEAGAAIAAQTPARPPPTTVMSWRAVSFLMRYVPCFRACGRDRRRGRSRCAGRRRR